MNYKPKFRLSRLLGYALGSLGQSLARIKISGLIKFFYMFDMSIRTGGIRNQSRKLSNVAPKFGRFLALPNFLGRAFQKLYARYHPCLSARRLEKFREDIPTSPKLLRLIR